MNPFPYIARPGEELIAKCLRLVAENEARKAAERRPFANDNVPERPRMWWEDEPA